MKHYIDPQIVKKYGLERYARDGMLLNGNRVYRNWFTGLIYIIL